MGRTRKVKGPFIPCMVDDAKGPIGAIVCVDGTVMTVTGGVSRKGALFQSVELTDATGGLRALVLEGCAIKPDDAVRVTGRLLADTRCPGSLVLMADRLEALWKGKTVVLLGDDKGTTVAVEPIAVLTDRALDALSRDGSALSLTGIIRNVVTGTTRWDKPYASFDLVDDTGRTVRVFAIDENPVEGERLVVEGILRIRRGDLELRACELKRA